MQVQILLSSTYEIVGAMDGDTCPSQDFLHQGEANEAASRSGLLAMLGHVAQNGLQGVPAAWSHEVNKLEGIYEFTKGQLRLFYFKGDRSQIVVCTTGGRKKGKKVDPKAVAVAIAFKKRYLEAVKAKTLEVLSDEDE
jgi:hypothetical protein